MILALEKVRLMNDNYIEVVCNMKHLQYCMMLFPVCCPPTLCALQQEGRIPYLGEVGTEEFLMKLTSQITEMVSAKITQGKSVIDLFVCSVQKPDDQRRTK